MPRMCGAGEGYGLGAVIDHAQRVLAAVIPGQRDRLMFILERLEPDHFRTPHHKIVFQLLERYWDITMDVLSSSALSDLLERQKVEAAKVLFYEEQFEGLTNTEVSEPDFRYSVDALRDIRTHQLTGEAIVAGMEILERGLDVGGEVREGHEASRAFLYDRLATIDGLGNSVEAPEGDIREETDEMLRDYASRKAGGTTTGILTSIPEIDQASSGIQPGELVMVCAYTGAGKSQLVTQTAVLAAIEQGRNVFFATSETVRRQVMRRIAARHSRHAMFGEPDGLNVRDIKDGTLSPDQEQVYQAVLTDLRSNPSYGKLYVAQVPRGAGLKFLEQRMIRQSSRWRIDLVIVDYLALLRSEQKRNSEREEFNEIIKGAKQLATSFNDGQGVGLISPWAMNQTAYRAAQDKGYYTLANLADTSEAEKSADQIWSIFWDREHPHEATMQMLKNRDGETPHPFQVQVDYRNSYIGGRHAQSSEELLGGDPFG